MSVPARYPEWSPVVSTEATGQPVGQPVGAPAPVAPPVSPLTALRRHWVIGAVLVVLGALVGVFAGTTRPVTYTAQARLAVGGQELRNFQIPGFALAAQEVASNYARYVGLPQSQHDFRTALGARSSQVLSVSGSPIATSNIVLIEVTATGPDVAIAAADNVATRLMTQANVPNTPSTSSYLSQYIATSRKVYALQAQLTAAKRVLARLDTAATAAATPTPVPSATPGAPAPVTAPSVNAKAAQAAFAAQQVVVDNLQTEISVLSVQQQTLSGQYSSAITGSTSYTQLVSAQTAVLTVDSRDRTVEKYGLAGAVLGVLVALVAAVLLEGRRLRRAARRSPPAPAPGR